MLGESEGVQDDGSKDKVGSDEGDVDVVRFKTKFVVEENDEDDGVSGATDNADANETMVSCAYDHRIEAQLPLGHVVDTAEDSPGNFIRMRSAIVLSQLTKRSLSSELSKRLARHPVTWFWRLCSSSCELRVHSRSPASKLEDSSKVST